MIKKHLWLVYLFCFLSVGLFAKTPKKLHVCTVANYEDEGLDTLIKSGKAYGIDVNVIGMGDPYPNHFTKISKMYRYLDRLQPDDIVLFVDGFDVFFISSGDEIMTKFLKKKVPCIFSAEKRWYPKNSGSDLKIPYPESRTAYRYLNAGSYIGYVSFLKLMLEEIIDNKYSIPLSRYRRLNDDQYHFHRYFLQNQKFVHLDTETEMFLPLAYVDKNELKIDKENKRIVVKETGNSPIAIHGNGSGKDLYREFVSLFFKK